MRETFVSPACVLSDTAFWLLLLGPGPLEDMTVFKTCGSSSVGQEFMAL